MKKNGIIRRLTAWTLAGALALSPSLAAAQTAVGETAKVVKKVTGQLNATTRDLVLKDMVYRNEAIATGSDAATLISFVDETNLTVGPGSSVVIDDFVYNASAADDAKFSLQMSKGVMRFVSGKMKKTA